MPCRHLRIQVCGLLLFEIHAHLMCVVAATDPGVSLHFFTRTFVSALKML